MTQLTPLLTSTYYDTHDYRAMCRGMLEYMLEPAPFSPGLDRNHQAESNAFRVRLLSNAITMFVYATLAITLLNFTLEAGV